MTQIVCECVKQNRRHQAQLWDMAVFCNWLNVLLDFACVCVVCCVYACVNMCNNILKFSFTWFLCVPIYAYIACVIFICYNTTKQYFSLFSHFISTNQITHIPSSKMLYIANYNFRVSKHEFTVKKKYQKEVNFFFRKQ